MSRRIRVSGVHYSGPKKVLVQSGIQLGTPDRPSVFAGDQAIIRRKRDNTYVCTSIERKNRCATSSDQETPEIDTSVDMVTSSSFYTASGGSYSAGITPLDLFLPPIESLGELTPLIDRQQDELLLCGLPKCTVCFPHGEDVGMVLTLSSDDEHPGGCWIWDFRVAPCPVYFESQGAYPTSGYSGFIVPPVGTGIGIVVVGHYAYIVLEGFQETFGIVDDFAGDVVQANLLVYDLSDPSSPSLVNTLVLDAGDGTYLNNVDIDARGELDTLWISGTYVTPIPYGDPTTPIVNPPGTIQRYDIGTRASPSLNTQFSIKVTARWSIHRHFDGSVFSGNPYIIALDATGQDTNITPLSTIDVIDGFSGSVVGTIVLSGSYNPFGDTYPYILICDNVAMLQFGSNLNAIDLSTPSSPTLLWAESGANTPSVYLGNNKAYVNTFSKLYTQVNVDDTSVDTDLPSVEDADPCWFFLDETCLYAVRGGVASSYRIAFLEHPRLSRTANTPISVFSGAIDRLSGIDIESDRLYLCSIGSGYLNVFSNTL